MRVRDVRAAPEGLRRRYLASIDAPQELYVEGLVKASRWMVLHRSGEPDVVGYAAVHDVTLVELFVAEASIAAWSAALDVVVAEAGVERALCKGFDVPLRDAAARRSTSCRAVGHLFRRIDEAQLRAVPAIDGRAATIGDVDAVLAMHDGFFDDIEEIEDYIARDGLSLYGDRGGEVQGCGVRKRIIAGLDAVDIGMVVAPGHRGRGLGARIVADLARRCVARGDRPVCGCAVENVASRRSLEAAGFRTEHDLVEFDLAGTSGPGSSCFTPDS